LLVKYDNDIDRSVAVQRLRDFFNPLLSENKSHEQNYKRFVLALLMFWTEERPRWLLNHLKEMASNSNLAPIFVEYMQTKMIQTVEVIEEKQRLDSLQAIKLLMSYNKL
jgi:hypothetical protein